MTEASKDRIELVVVSAPDDAALAAEASRIVAFIDRMPDASLTDVAYTCALSHGPAVLALVVSSVQELRARLASARDRILSGAARIRDKSGTYYFREHLIGEGKGKLAFVYPGVMSYYPDMSSSPLRRTTGTTRTSSAPVRTRSRSWRPSPDASR